MPLRTPEKLAKADEWDAGVPDAVASVPIGRVGSVESAAGSATAFSRATLSSSIILREKKGNTKDNTMRHDVSSKSNHNEG